MIGGMVVIIMIMAAMPLTNMSPAMMIGLTTIAAATMILPNQPATMPVVAHPPPIIIVKSANLHNWHFNLHKRVSIGYTPADEGCWSPNPGSA